MSTEETGVNMFKLKHVILSFIGGAIVGGALSGALTYLTVSLDYARNGVNLESTQRNPLGEAPPKYSPPANAAAHEAVRGESASTDNQSQLPIFVSGKEVPLVVPADTPPEKVMGIFIDETKKMQRITIGNGENEMWVYFDPLCTVCHETFDLLYGDQRLAEKYHIKAHWIPVHIFQTDASVVASLYLTDLLIKNKQEMALAYYRSILAKKPNPVPENWLPNDQTRAALDHATMAVMQLDNGQTPSIVFKSKSTGTYRFIPGKPSAEDLADVAK